MPTINPSNPSDRQTPGYTLLPGLLHRPRMGNGTNTRHTPHSLIPHRNMRCVDRRRTIVMRHPMMLPGLLTVQLHPHLVEGRKPSLCTIAHSFPVLDFLLDKRGVHAIRDFVHGDIAAVEGLRPENVRVDGDVVDVLQTVVGDRGHGYALAAVGLDVEFVGGLAGAVVAFHVGLVIARRTFRVEMRPDPGRCRG